jgi:hypothetical protein
MTAAKVLPFDQDAGDVQDIERDRIVLDMALRLVRAGYVLTPVTLTRGSDGRKRARFHRSRWQRGEEENASSDPERVRDWWVTYPGTSFAIVCGRSGVEAVDLDVKPADGVDGVRWWSERSLPLAGMVVETVNGGMHLITRRRSDRQLPTAADTIARGIDTRSVGGCLFAPGSYVRGEEGGYAIQGELVPVDQLAYTPDEVLDLVPADVPKVDRPRNGEETQHHREWIVRQVDDQVSRVARHDPRAGGFRHLLLGAALVVGRAVDAGVIEHDDAVTRLKDAASAVWGEADADDARWIADGMTDGPTLERWHARRGPRLIQPPLLASVPTGPEAGEDALDGGGLNLPASFWQERESLRHVEQAARARWASPDAVLGVALARLSSYLHPADTVDLGIGCGPLSVFTIVYGPSSAGKGTAARTGAELLAPPESVALGTFRERPLGSGEGLTESYFGMVTMADAAGKSVKVHKQVRSNVLFTADEGEAVLKTAGRKGSTVATTIRRAWSGEILGEANATAERNRQLERGSYGIGMILAFQPATIGALFDENEVGGGTPQRLLFFAADDDSLPEAPPDELPRWPGVLTVPTVRQAPGEACRFVLTDEDARQEVRMTRWRGLRRQHEPGKLDGHETTATGPGRGAAGPAGGPPGGRRRRLASGG